MRDFYIPDDSTTFRFVNDHRVKAEYFLNDKIQNQGPPLLATDNSCPLCTKNETDDWASLPIFDIDTRQVKTLQLRKSARDRLVSAVEQLRQAAETERLIESQRRTASQFRYTRMKVRWR